MIKNKIVITLILITFGYITTYAQVSDKIEIQRLSESSYEDLSTTFQDLDPENDTVTTKLYARAFLLKAKKENNTIKKADGYYMLANMYSKVSTYKKALTYSDSIITITKDKNDYNYPAKAHLLKATILGSQSNFQESMNELVEANTYANDNNNIEQQYQIKYFIAILKNNLGEPEDSLEILKNVVEYYETKFLKNNKYEDKSEYIKALYAYGITLNILEAYDSVKKINNKAIHLSLKTKDSSHYSRLLLSSAVVHYNKKEYQPSLDSIRKLQKINTNKKIGPGAKTRINFFLGRILYKQKKIDSSVYYLLKVDSLAFKNNFFFPSIRENYELLIQYYKKRGNTEKQLFYIDRLLTVDSILDKDVKYLSHKINEEYSKPNLILEKQQIIESLERKSITKIGIVVSLFSIILIVIITRNNRKQKIYKKRFQELLENKESNETTLTKGKETQGIIEKEPKEIGISEIIVNDILKNLAKFEENNDFLQSNISVASLSKRFKTNSKYLSKVININKDKSFSNYVNELRINYVIEELKINSKFRRYTIRAIANEIGFNTTEAFSKSFYKTTGIYPSFFMKQLEKQENSKNL